MLRGEMDIARDALQDSKYLVSQARGELAIVNEQAQHMMNLIVVLSA
jgi:hypothetical protein